MGNLVKRLLGLSAFILVLSCQNGTLIPPLPVSNLAVVEGDGQVSLSWKNPTEIEFDSVHIAYDPDSTVLLVQKGEESRVVKGLSNGVQYTFSVRIFDKAGNGSDPRVITAVPVSAQTGDGEKDTESATTEGQAGDVNTESTTATTDGQTDKENTDTTAPGVVRNLLMTLDGADATLTWDSPEDTDIKSYVLYSSAVSLILSSEIHTYTFADSEEWTAYSIRSVDQAGNESAGLGLASAADGSMVKIIAEDGLRNSRFGTSAAVSGDTALIGMPHDGPGYVYVYRKTGSSWILEQRLTSSNGEDSDGFGFSVALDGDRALIGSPYDDNNGSNSGSAFLFSRTSGKWYEDAILTAGDAEAQDQFGYSVALRGDFAVVGAPFEETGGNDSGAVYAFTRDGVNWPLEAKLSSDRAFSRFGYSIGMGDSILAIGAPYDSRSADYAGILHTYKRSGDRWDESLRLTAAQIGRHNQFGTHVASSGSTVLVGVPNDDTRGEGAGAVYAFKESDGVWSSATLTATDAEAGRGFGTSVAFDGDTALIGASLDDDKGTNAGAAYLFRRSGVNWAQLKKVFASTADDNDSFGHAVGLSGTNAIIGAHDSDDSEVDSGSAYALVVE